jgi:hypothetical protein
MESLVGMTGFEPATHTSRIRLEPALRDSICINVNRLAHSRTQESPPKQAWKARGAPEGVVSDPPQGSKAAALTIKSFTKGDLS